MCVYAVLVTSGLHSQVAHVPSRNERRRGSGKACQPYSTTLCDGTHREIPFCDLGDPPFCRWIVTAVMDSFLSLCYTIRPSYSAPFQLVLRNQGFANHVRYAGSHRLALYAVCRGLVLFFTFCVKLTHPYV
jgi:hypothetical protein